MIAIIDYGVGNLFSLKSSLACVGADAIVTNDAETIKSAEKIILPGVGAFKDASDKLFSSGLADVVISEANNGKPLLGICLGMQMLFEKSYEYGESKGLGLLKGEIKPLSDVIDKNLKIPHIGWNSLKFHGEKSPLFKYINENDYVYFVHSFFASGCDDSLIATAEYSADITAAVGKNNIFGCQFHPEKSGNVGLNILRAFCEKGGI
ncbi:MAG: imidazole glycerol phosphate synthase subunit HisH [Ruminococcaceae bacterium]|nr:imidazole glycerol phosphate synthase subunit HisH [Oscillospiraceae bacterium]